VKDQGKINRLRDSTGIKVTLKVGGGRKKEREVNGDAIFNHKDPK